LDFALTPERAAFRDTVRTWVDRECPKDRALAIDNAGEYPHDVFDAMAEAGFHAVGLPVEYGGAGGDVIDQCLLARELGRSLAGMATLYTINSFAGGKSVGLYGSDEQKERLIPPLARGELKFAISVTEPSGGTDLLGAMRTTARRTDGGWLVSGSKIWSTQAHVADYLLLLARTDQTVAKKTQGTTLFLVRNPSAGLTIQTLPKLGLTAIGSCAVFLDDVFVPDEDVLGEPGSAWYQLLGTLNNERIITAAISLGILDGVIEEAQAHLLQREAFGQPIGKFQILQHQLADMLIAQNSARLVVFEAAWRQSRGMECGLQANMARLVACEAAVDAADTGIQMLGGMGYSKETQMQRYWRDARLFRIGPISDEMARNSIAEMVGMPRSF
jgi:acyl-CoA dehydrogenase